MISMTIRGLARALRADRDMADLVADRLDTLAEAAALLEAAAVPDRLRCPVALPPGVISLATWRRKA